jgi:general secretion pathway protein H
VRSRGFTLLEILVVVVIIAVMTTVGMLSMGSLGQDREIDGELDRYTDTLAAALEQAQLEGRDYGVHYGPAAYEIIVYAPERQRWEPVLDDRLFEQHKLPDGVEFRVEIEGRSLRLGMEKPTEPLAPQVVLFASGDVTPYRLQLVRQGVERKFTIVGAPDGTMEILRPEAAP